eukprot:UN07833
MCFKSLKVTWAIKAKNELCYKSELCFQSLKSDLGYKS